MTGGGGLLERLGTGLREAVDKALPAGVPVALIGVPLWTNVGDHAIFLGTLRYLRERGHEIVYLAAQDRDYSPSRLRRSLDPEGAILIAGGGWLNDIWPGHRGSRQQVVLDHLDRRIVLLPGSIHLPDDASRETAAAALGEHPDLTLLARDSESLRLSEGLGCETLSCPDIAFALGSLERPTAPTREIAWLLRRDRESGLDAPLPGVGEDQAWAGSEPWLRRPPVILSQLAARTVARRGGAAAASTATEACRRYSRRRLAAGAKVLAEGRAAVTDRLHGHILCLLLGIPHVLLDTAQGKVLAFHRTWTADSELTRTATGLEQAGELARGLAS